MIIVNNINDAPTLTKEIPDKIANEH